MAAVGARGARHRANEVIASLKARSFTSAPPRSAGGEEESTWRAGGVCHTDCAICLTAFQPGTQVKDLACYHTFCAKCVDSWIRNMIQVRRCDHASCPLCKEPIGASLAEVAAPLVTTTRATPLTEDDDALESVDIPRGEQVTPRLSSEPGDSLSDSAELRHSAHLQRTGHAAVLELHLVSTDANETNGTSHPAQAAGGDTGSSTRRA